MKKILIVDDKTNWPELLTACLQPKPYEIFQARSSLEAIALAKREKPNLILLDIMPDAKPNGFELCQLLKTDIETGHAFVIMLTTPGQELDADELVAAGADGRLVRPLNLHSATTNMDQLQAILESKFTIS